MEAATEWCSFFDLVRVCCAGLWGGKKNKNWSLICVRFLYLVLKALSCVTDVGESFDITQAQMLQRPAQRRYTPLILSIASTHTHAHNPDCRPLTYFPVLELRRWDSGLNEKWQQYLPLSLPPSLTSFISPFLPQRSAALRTFQVRSSQRAPLSAAVLLVCEYAHSACVWCASIRGSSGCVWLLYMRLFDVDHSTQRISFLQ